MSWKDRIKTAEPAAPEGASSWRDRIKTDSSAAGAAVLKAAQGAAAGFGDELSGVVEAVGSKVGLRGLGGSLSDIRSETKEEDAQSFAEVYKEGRDKKREVYDQAQKDHPVVSTVSEVGGSLASALIPGVNTVKGAAALGAVSGLGMSDADNVKDLAIDTAIGGTVGGVAQKYLPGAIDATKKVVGNASKKAGEVLFGVGEEATERYLQNPEKMRSVIAEGTDGLRSIKDRVDEAYSQRVTKIREDAASGLIDAKAAKREADREFQAYLAQLKNLKPSDTLTEDVLSGISSEKKKLSKLSSDAFDTLEGAKFNRDEVLGILDRVKEGMHVDGQRPVIGDAKGAYSVVEKLQSAIRNRNVPETNELMEVIKEAPGLEGSDLKKFIQQLDQEASEKAYSLFGGSGNDEYIKGIRRPLDGFLKDTVPAYRDAMVPTAQQADFVASLTDVFGDAETARRVLLQAADPEKGPAIRNQLKLLDKNNGTKILEGMDEYLNAQKILKDPEARQMTQSMMTGPASRDLETAQKTAKAADVLRSRFNRVAPGSSEGTIERVGRDRNFEGEKQLRELVGEKGLEDVKDFALGKDFVTDKTRGARRTAAGAIAGGAVGSLLGPVGTAVGTTLGAAAGATIDKLGGQIWQKVLDGSIKAGPFAKILEEASKSGPAAVGATHLLLMQKEPAYRKAVESEEAKEAAKRYKERREGGK